VSTRVGLVGVNGHGRWHLDNMKRLSDEGIGQIAAVCDRAPIEDELRSIVTGHGGQVFQSYEKMLAEANLDIVVIATPPHVHRSMACSAMTAGIDVLLEKPPTVRLADLEEVSATARRTGRLCQVGFQSLGSAALDKIRELLKTQVLGEVSNVSAAGAWSRPPSYFSRGPWTGRRLVGEVAVGDGALANPFAHALMNCLSIATADGPSAATEITPEMFHANDIESDDTSALRVVLHNGRTITIAVTLCADELLEPYILVKGSSADLLWRYTEGGLELRPHGERARAVPLGQSSDLLRDLIAVRSGSKANLRCPIDACRDFTAISEALLDQASVRSISAEYVTKTTDDTDTPIIVPGIAALVQRAAADDALFSELDVPWSQELTNPTCLITPTLSQPPRTHGQSVV
jgi:predicted dehydrogenase